MNKETGPLPFDKENIPRHIAFVMDGNGRWAQKRGLPVPPDIRREAKPSIRPQRFWRSWASGT